LGDLWDLEKFSLKESHQDYEVEVKTAKLWELTKAICFIEKVIMNNPIKNYRETILLYD